MSKLLIRFFVHLVVPSLIMDPVLAIGLSPVLIPGRQAVSESPSRRLEREALAIQALAQSTWIPKPIKWFREAGMLVQKEHLGDTTSDVKYDRAEPPYWKDWRFWGLIGLALAIRLPHLGYNGPYIDESVESFPKMGNVFFLSGDSHLWPYINDWLQRVGGIEVARAASAACVALTTGLIYPLAKDFAKRLNHKSSEGRSIGLIAGLLFTLSTSTLFVGEMASYHALAYLLYVAGFVLLIRGLRTGRNVTLIAAAGALILSFSTRYMLLGYLPVAILFALLPDIHTFDNRQKWASYARTFRFLAALTALVGIYYWMDGIHILAAIAYSTENANRVRSGKAALELVASAFRLQAPILLLALAGIILETKNNGSNGQVPAKAHAIATLAIGTFLILGYHIWAGHDMQLLQNLVLTAVFGSILGAFALERLRRIFTFDQGSWWLGAAHAFMLVVILGQQGAARLAEVQKWPDWRPVAAAAQSLPPEGKIWSTANEWSPGNVWYLSRVLGVRVDTSSPWFAPRDRDVLELAREEGIPFVVGPLQGPRLEVGSLENGFIVRSVIDVPNGLTSYIFENVNPSFDKKAYDALWTNGKLFVVSKKGRFGLANAKAIRFFGVDAAPGTRVALRLLPKDHGQGEDVGVIPGTFSIDRDSSVEISLEGSSLSSEDLDHIEQIDLYSGSGKLFHSIEFSPSNPRARYKGMEIIKLDSNRQTQNKSEKKSPSLRVLKQAA